MENHQDIVREALQKARASGRDESRVDSPDSFRMSHARYQLPLNDLENAGGSIHSITKANVLSLSESRERRLSITHRTPSPSNISIDPIITISQVRRLLLYTIFSGSRFLRTSKARPENPRQVLAAIASDRRDSRIPLWSGWTGSRYEKTWWRTSGTSERRN